MTLELRDLRFAWPGAAGPVLDGISLTLPPAARVAVIGANGSGKTTLARCIAGWQESAAVLWRGQPWAGQGRAARVAAVQMVGQRPDLQLSGRAPSLRREVAFGPENLGRPRAEIAERAAEALERMGLAPLADRDGRHLSGGEAQRLAIACTLAMRPDLLVLDEPVTDLDQGARAALGRHLAGLEGLAVVCLDVEPRDWMAGYTFLRLSGGRLEPFRPPAPRTGTPAALPPGAEAPLVIDGVGFGHDPQNPLFTGVGLTLPAGALVAVTGPNGAGKSTLMRLISGLARPQQGRIRVAGRDPAEKAEETARLIGMVPQHADRQFLATRVREEVAFAARQLRLPDPGQAAGEALAALGLEGLAEAHPFDLDSGARRLVAVAAAAAHRPKLLILDEAQRGLDAANTARLERFLQGERARGALILAVCHDMDFAARNATHLLRVGGGTVSVAPRG